MKKSSLLFVIALFVSVSLFAETINVPGDQPTIQTGINTSTDGDIILVQPGTYLENINYNGKNITVASLFLTTQDTSYISQTIIDGNSLNRVVKFNNGEDSTAVLTGFTITNGNSFYGGGIHCESSSPSLLNLKITGNNATSGGGIMCSASSPSLYNVTITGNSAVPGGGIFCCNNSSPSLYNVTITGNSAQQGGGIKYFASSLSLEYVTITGNSASSYGGGIHCGGDDSSLSLQNVTISGNSASAGGGIYGLHSQDLLENVTITGNYAERGGGIYCSGSPSLQNVTITANSAGTKGGGIYCSALSLSLQNVTITANSAGNIGGGIYCEPNSSLIFSTSNRSNIYSNTIENMRGYGSDIYVKECDTIHVIVDTFTVMTPTDYYASPINNFTFDILHSIESNLINADVYVAVDGDDSNTGTSADDPFRTIKHALSLIYSDSLNINTIHLATGVYSDSTNGETFPIKWSNYVNLQGIGEDETILDANQTACVMDFYHITNSTISNITITNGSAYNGGGISCWYNSSPILMNVTITGNTADYAGGGIYCINNSSPSLEDVTIMNNSSHKGGGLYCYLESSPNLLNVTISNNNAYNGGGISCWYNSSPILMNVTITGNTADEYGGGIYCRENSNPILDNVTITGNSADYGGGIYFSNSSPSLDNVTITGNNADYGGGINCVTSFPSLVNVTITGNNADYYGGGIYCSISPNLVNCIVSDNTGDYGIYNFIGYSGNTTIAYSNFWNNENGNFYGVNDSIGINITTNANGDNCDVFYNIQLDPLFINPDNFNYHLMDSSPCIDAGTAFFVLEGDTLVNIPDSEYYGLAPDMGAYEYLPINEIFIWPGDTDNNCIVDEGDIDAIAVYWNEEGDSRNSISFEWVAHNIPANWIEPLAPLADCNGDGIVNITDVLALCLNWEKSHETYSNLVSFSADELMDKKDNFVEIYNSLGNSNIEIQIRNHIAERFDLPFIEVVEVNRLYNNYPNPFNPTTKIRYSIADKGNIELSIYNIKGQLVRRFQKNDQNPGNYSIVWNGLDMNNNKVSSCMYFYKLENDGKTIDTKKMLLIK